MLTRNFLIKFAAVIFIALSLAGLPASISAADNDSWRPDLPPAGIGSVVFINHNGTGMELNVDLAGTLYKVPIKVNDIPGRLQLDLAPGTYTYSASIGGIDTATGTVEVVAGRVTELSIVAEKLIDPHCDAADRDDHSCDAPEWNVLVYQTDITNQAQ